MCLAVKGGVQNFGADTSDRFGALIGAVKLNEDWFFINPQGRVVDDPVNLEGAGWTQVWAVTNISSEEAAARTLVAKNEAAIEAARLMQETEQYYLDAMIAGYGFTFEMTEYVQTLENFTTISGYPKTEVMDWPRLPNTILEPTNPDLPVDMYTRSQVNAAIAGADTYTRAEVDALIANAVQSLLVTTRSGAQIDILN
jgi:hypothetical protein